MMRAQRVVELTAVSLIFVGISLFSAHLQSLTPPTPAWYGAKYVNMAQQFRSGAHVVSERPPWVYRIGTPWLASFASESAINASRPFLIINIASAFGVAALLLVWFTRFVPTSAIRVLLVTLFLITWVGPARFVYFTPAYVDPLFFVFLLIGLVMVDATRLRPPMESALLLAPVVFVGTLCRESMGVVGLAFLGCHDPVAAVRAGRWREAAWTMVPLLAAFLAVVFDHFVAIPTGPDTALSLPLSLIGHKSLLTWTLTWFFTFGPPVVALVVLDRRSAITFLRREPHLLLYLLGCGALSYFGGVDDERVTLWAAPVVYVLTARAIEHHRAALRSVALVLALAAAQVVSARALWPIPAQGVAVASISHSRSITAWVFDAVNRLVVIDTYYSNLWSYWGSRPWHYVLLAYDIGFVIVIGAWIRLIERPSGRVGSIVEYAGRPDEAAEGGLPRRHLDAKRL